MSTTQQIAEVFPWSLSTFAVYSGGLLLGFLVFISICCPPALEILFSKKGRMVFIGFLLVVIAGAGFGIYQERSYKINSLAKAAEHEAEVEVNYLRASDGVVKVKVILSPARTETIFGSPVEIPAKTTSFDLSLDTAQKINEAVFKPRGLALVTAP